MSHAVSLVNAFAATWAAALFRACWQGGLGIALVWLLCRLWPALPTNPRCWLWRLAYAKLLLGLVWLPPLALPLLPVPPAAPPVVQAATPPVPTLPDDAPRTAVEPAPAMPAASPVFLAAPATPPAPVPLPPLPRPTLPTPQTWLLAAWLLGLSAGLGRIATAWRRACALSRASRPLADDALQADAADLAPRLGLRRVPPLHVVGGLASPLLLGLGRPAILLPAFVVSGSPRPELRLMLAHEMAHLARRDLLWNALPLLAQRLFFFHPLVWLAGHEWALAQEIACDALAVETTGTPPSAYGRMLLSIATRRPSAAPLFPTLAVAAPRHTLRRRLHAMQHIGTVSRPRLILAAALTALLAVGGLLPWHVVAQSGTAASAPPAAMRAEEARQATERADYAIWEAQADAQFAEALGRVPPARQKEVQASIASMDAYIAKSQKHTLMMEQHRADYIATHPYRLSNAQRNDITRLLDLNVRRNGLNQSVAMGRILRVKLLADVAASKDTASKESYRAQIGRDDSRRRTAEREMRLLEPRIAQQKLVVALIPQDQRTLMDKLRHYDVDVWCGRIEALTIKRSRVQVLQRLLAAKPPRQRQGTTIKASSVPPEAKTASFNAVVTGGPPPLRLAQSAAPPVPARATQTPPMWQEEERKEQTDLALWNAKSDTQLAEVQKSLSPAQLAKVQPEIDTINADYAKEQQSVQVLEKSRADYIATHPNHLTDAQIAEVEQLKWHISESDRIRSGINQRLVVRGALRTRIAATHDTGLKAGWGRQIEAIDLRQREDERRIRELAPSIARQEAKLAAFPADQRERVAILRRYAFEIIVGRMHAYEQKRANVFELYVEYVTSKQRHGSEAPEIRRSGGAITEAASVPPHASPEPFYASAASVNLVQRLYIFPQRGREPRQHIQVFRQDATDRQLILDKFTSGGGPIVSPPVPAEAKLLVYINGKLSKDVIPPFGHINKRKLTHLLQRHMFRG